jgi:hypothetical protein
MDTRINAYRGVKLEEEDALRLAWRSYKADVFPWAKGADVLEEFTKPQHPEFADGSLWGFFNAVTENLKPRNEKSKASGLWTLPARTGRLHKICDDWAGLKINTQLAAVALN